MTSQLSAFAQKNLDAKHEKIMKELCKLAGNRRCVDCDCPGPQYVIPSFGVFVCTSCGGMHRQYGHRVKGISMSRFSVEEISSLQSGGNERFFALYCARWNQSALPRPTDHQSTEKSKAWIESVYVQKRFYSDEIAVKQVDDVNPTDNGTTRETNGSIANGRPATVSVGDKNGEASDFPIVHLGDLGGVLPKLQIALPAAASKASSGELKKTAADDDVKPKHAPASQPAQPPAQPSLADDDTIDATNQKEQHEHHSQPKIDEKEQEPPAAAPVVVSSLLDSWDPFGDAPDGTQPQPHNPPAVHSQEKAKGEYTPVAVENGKAQHIVVESFVATTQHEHLPRSKDTNQAGIAEWSAFADQDDVQTSLSHALTGTTIHTEEQIQSMSVENTMDKSNWIASFGAPVAPVLPGSLASSLAPSLASNGTSNHGPLHEHGDAHKGNDQNGTKPSIAPSPSPQPPFPTVNNNSFVTATSSLSLASPSITPRPEIALDAFYPEFEKIRATGMLPTGQPVIQAQMTHWGVAKYGVHQSSPSPLPQQPQQHMFGRPPPLDPVALSQQQQVHYNSQSPYSQPQALNNMYSPHGMPLPSPSLAPSPFSMISPMQQQQQQQHPWHYTTTHPSLAGNVSASMTATTTTPVPTNGVHPSQSSLGVDPFAELTGFNLGGNNRGSAPLPVATTPTPNLAPSGLLQTQTQAASATLFGLQSSITSYDLSAPAAPKPRTSGNPFA